MNQLLPLNSAGHNPNTLDTVLELLKALNNKLDASTKEVKALRNEARECRDNNEAMYSQLQQIQTAMDRSVAQSGVRNGQMEEMGTVMTHMAKVLGLFTIGIKGIDGMKSGIVQQFRSSEKANATKNSCKIICLGVIKACYQEYARGKNISSILSIPDNLLNVLLQSGIVMRANVRREAGYMLLGGTKDLDRQDIGFYLEMLHNNDAKEITNAVDTFMELLRGPMRIFIDEPLYKMLLSTTIAWRRPTIRFDTQRNSQGSGDLKECWAQCCEPRVTKAILNFPWNTPTEIAPNTGALIYAIRNGTINAAGEYYHNVSINGKLQNPTSPGWTGPKGKSYPRSPMDRLKQVTNAHNGRDSPNSYEAGAKEDTVPFVNPLERNKR